MNTTTCRDCWQDFLDRDLLPLTVDGGAVCAQRRAECLMGWLNLSADEWEATPDTVKEKLWIAYWDSTKPLECASTV